MSKGLSIVIPVYNEEGNLKSAIDSIISAIKDMVADFEIIVVNDGSTDRSLEIAESASKQCHQIRVFSHTKNLGQGTALATGYAQCRKDYVTYVPADGQVNPAELINILKAAEDADIIITFRSNRFDYSFFRLINSFVYIALNQILFGLKYRDINWVHMYNRRIFEKVKIRSTGVFILGEILAKAKRIGFTIKEIPSTYYPRKNGRAKGGRPKSVFTAIKEMFRLWWRMEIMNEA